MLDQFSSVIQSCLTLCHPIACSTPCLLIHHQLLEFTQTHVHWVGDAIWPSHPLSSPSSPTFNLSQHSGLFKWVSSLYQVVKGMLDRHSIIFIIITQVATDFLKSALSGDLINNTCMFWKSEGYMRTRKAQTWTNLCKIVALIDLCSFVHWLNISPGARPPSRMFGCKDLRYSSSSEDRLETTVTIRWLWADPGHILLSFYVRNSVRTLLISEVTSVNTR